MAASDSLSDHQSGSEDMVLFKERQLLQTTLSGRYVTEVVAFPDKDRDFSLGTDRWILAVRDSS